MWSDPRGEMSGRRYYSSVENDDSLVENGGVPSHRHMCKSVFPATCEDAPLTLNVLHRTIPH